MRYRGDVMKTGICIEGGGAKGAYEAGIIKALYDRGIKRYDYIAGTSIGSVTGYFLITGNVEKLVDMWKNIDCLGVDKVENDGITVDNSPVINILNELSGEIDKDSELYVNYVKIDGCKMNEVVEEVSHMNKEDMIERIKYSSLLPFNPDRSMKFRDRFALDLQKGIYDGYCLDGGLIRGLMLDPVFDKNPDRIVIISTKDDFEVPEELREKHKNTEIIVVKPEQKFDPKATLYFEKNFCNRIFEEGYRLGMQAADRHGI